jgi:hypothetical protein
MVLVSATLGPRMPSEKELFEQGLGSGTWWGFSPGDKILNQLKGQGWYNVHCHCTDMHNRVNNRRGRVNKATCVSI